MKKRSFTMLLAGVMALSMTVAGCGKQADGGPFTPTKNINWTVTSSAGGGSDIFTRMIADVMKNEDLVNGQTVVVTNKTDGAGV